VQQVNYGTVEAFFPLIILFQKYVGRSGFAGHHQMGSFWKTEHEMIYLLRHVGISESAFRHHLFSKYLKLLEFVIIFLRNDLFENKSIVY